MYAIKTKLVDTLANRVSVDEEKLVYRFDFARGDDHTLNF
jgi:hypothetical protein